MLKTLLKMVLGVLILAGLFFFALQIWERQREKRHQESSSEAETSNVVSIKDVTVLNSPVGAVIQVHEISSAGYKLIATEDPKGFFLNIPSAGLSLSQNTLSLPHPLVPKIEASQTGEQNNSAVQLRVQLAPNTKYRDRAVGNTLYIDIVADTVTSPSPSPTGVESSSSTKTEISEPKPTLAPKKSKKSEKAGVKVRKPLSKTSKFSKADRKTKVKTKTGARAKESRVPQPPPQDDTESLLRDISEAPIPTPELMKELPSEPTTIPEPSSPMPPSAEEEPLDVDKLFGGPQPPAENETVPFEDVPPPKMAAVPPLLDQKFDASKILENLPSITDIAVLAEEGATTVTISRDAKAKYKVFRQVNPNRIVVEFLNTANRLAPEYQEFPGTKVRKITTQQFAGPDGTITRVIMYVDGPPQFDANNKGKDFVLRLP